MHGSSRFAGAGRRSPARRWTPARWQTPAPASRIAALGVLAAVVLVLGGPLLLGGPLARAAANRDASCVNANLRPTRADLPAVDAATVCLIDRVRGDAHLQPLRPNPSLHGVAARQSAEMVLGDYFGDENRSGQTPLQRIFATPYPRHSTDVSTAQNIGWGTDAHATPAAIVAAWMHSPPHRQIILTREFRDIGAGAAPAAPASLAAGQPGATYTVEFGTRQS